VARLTSQPDVHAIDKSTWSRDLICHDGATRPQASITFGKKQDVLEVFYQTTSHAEKGRLWFDALMGEAVQFIDRTTLTPSEAIEKFIHKNYANWADEPIPMFKNRTPRQEMQTVAGLERVKGLLRSYQDGEIEQAKDQGRKPVSYQFLWDALGLD
jgi:Protein of unknown function (DUF2384)